MSDAARDPRVVQYHRQAAVLTHAGLLHPLEKESALGAIPVWRRKAARQELESQWEAVEAQAAAEADGLITRYEDATAQLDRALDRLRTVVHVRLRGKVMDEKTRLARTRTLLGEVRQFMQQRDVGGAGRSMQAADRELWTFGGQLIVALNAELQSSAYSRELLQQLATNQQQRRQARTEIERVRERQGGPQALLASLTDYLLMADALELVARALHQPVVDQEVSSRSHRLTAANAVTVVQPQDLERLCDVGGLEAAKEEIRGILDAHVGLREEATRYGVHRASLLFHGPPGTGKTLLARAMAGEYGMRYLRVTPATIASPYQHERATTLTRVFSLAAESVPCVLFLDELDALGGARSGSSSSDHREVVSQLLTLLDDHRRTSGLVIVAATNALEVVDAALRESRFDVRIQVPMPDASARRAILEVHLRSRSSAVAWDDLDLDDIAQRLAGRTATGVAAVVTAAAHHAMRTQGLIGQAELLAAVSEREARDRRQLEVPVRWEDVVLPPALEQRLTELFRVVQRPELAEAMGISAPAGIILHGPPGTGKTTIAKALATEVRASFYEMSAAELLSKWVGESEERVAHLFATARENRPSIIFIDEIDALLRRRSASSVAPWEERLVSQFLRELDGLSSLPGVFLVGATNRLDIIDEAVKNRRLLPLEVPLPDLRARRTLLGKLLAKVRLDPGVDLDELAQVSEGMSGADLKRLRDEVGIKALSRGLRDDESPESVAIGMDDFYASLHERKAALIPD